MIYFLRRLFRTLSQSERKRGWRVGHRGRDSFFYDEIVEGKWERILIDGQMPFSSCEVQHVVWFPSEAEWSKFPAWTVGRRDLILQRMKQELAPPSYQYE